MAKQDPNTWYLPESITKANSAGINSNLFLEEATEIFRELEKRGIIVPVTAKAVTAGTTGVPGTVQEFEAWTLDRTQTEKIREITNQGPWSIKVNSTLRYLFAEKNIIWLGLVFLATAFFTGFVTHAGELWADAIFSKEEPPKKAPSPPK